MYTYERLRQLAIQSGIPDNKVSIGFWIKSKGLKKIKKQVDKVRKIYYVPDENTRIQILPPCKD